MKTTKTAVSIPREVFVAAESVARRLGVSRSALYAKALAEFVARHGSADVTARLDELYGAAGATVAPDVVRAQTDVLSRDKW